MGEVPGLAEAPPDYGDMDSSLREGLLATWQSVFEPVGAVFVNPAEGRLRKKGS